MRERAANQKLLASFRSFVGLVALRWLFQLLGFVIV